MYNNNNNNNNNNKVTSPEMCHQLLDLHQSGVDVKLLVGPRVSDQHDCPRAQACYAYLYDKGYDKVRFAPLNYSHAHMKYWIMDSTTAVCATGNWSPEDFPTTTTTSTQQQQQQLEEASDFIIININDDNVYPPYGEKGWQDVNRDFTLYTQDSQVVLSLQTAFENDYSGPDTSYWTPDNMVQCI
jgi:hypothetical protein